MHDDARLEFGEFQGRFFAGGKGRLYATIHGPWPARRLIVHWPAFAEEMNLSRAVVSRQAREFSRQGWTVLIVDHYGTGDSEGDIAEADAELWLQDMHAILTETGAQLEKPPIFWGLRFGALLAATYIQRYGAASVSGLLLWKPVTDGRMMLNQFFRLKQMNAMMQGGEQAKTNWFKQVQAGDTTEVAGYEMTPALVNSIVPLNFAGAVDIYRLTTCWIEPGANAVTPVVQKQLEQWPQGLAQLELCAAPTFWQSPDIYEAPELLQLTGKQLEQWQC